MVLPRREFGMWGAIIGDTVGSPYEWNNVKSADFPLFSRASHFTDDTVMTAAVAEGLMDGCGDEEATRTAITASMLKFGKMFPLAGYGHRFRKWLESAEPRPYNSFGNGSAMRVSPVAWAFDNLAGVEKFASISARVTHDHPEGVKGASSVAGAIFLARTGSSRDEIKKYVEYKYQYDLNRKLDDIRKSYKFDESCQGSVPEAIIAFLESETFEDALRKAVFLGGDSDTIAAITGSVAEGFYGGAPDDMKHRAEHLLDKRILSVIERWNLFIYAKRKEAAD
jgi:ADP-ribosylglycohydrolase